MGGRFFLVILRRIRRISGLSIIAQGRLITAPAVICEPDFMRGGGFVKTHEREKPFLPFPTKEIEPLKNGENMIDGEGRI